MKGRRDVSTSMNTGADFTLNNYSAYAKTTQDGEEFEEFRDSLQMVIMIEKAKMGFGRVRARVITQY
jgi:hypothetical protein